MANFSQQLQDKIWEWPGDEASVDIDCGDDPREEWIHKDKKTMIEMEFEPNSLSILAVPGKTLTPHALKRHSKKDIVIYTCIRISITYSLIPKIFASGYGDIDTLQEVN